MDFLALATLCEPFCNPIIGSVALEE